MAAEDTHVVEVTGCIYKLGEEKSTSKWSFLTKIDGKDHFQFLEKLRKECGVQKRCDELGIKTFTLKLQCRRLVSEADFTKKESLQWIPV